MANTLPLIKKAFLATRNSGSGSFLLTERFENNGDLLFYIIESSDVKAAEKLQKSIQDNLVKNFCSASDFSISSLEQGLHFINQRKDQENSKRLSTAPINALIGLLDSNYLHISMIGNLEGYLLRKGKINSITEGLSNREDDSFTNITSGELLVGDLAIIANKSLFNRLSLDRIRRTLNQFSPREAVENIYQILRRSKCFDCNAILIQAVSPLVASNDNENLPDLLYLDEIIESSFSKFVKKAKPVVAGIWAEAKSAMHKFLSWCGKSVKSLQTYWQKNISPYSKSVISNAANHTSKQLSRISPKIINGDKSHGKNNLKIKPYYRKNSAQLNKFSTNVLRGFGWLTAKENRRFLYIGLVVILVVFSFAKISSNNKNREQIKKQNDAVYAFENAQSTFKTASEDIALGKQDGIAKLQEALVQAQSASQVESTKIKAQALLKDIQAKVDELSNTKRYYGLNPIFSFKYEPVVSAVSGSKIYAFSDEGKIYMTDSRDKDPKLVGALDSSLGKAVSATYSDSMNLLFVLTDQAKVWAFDEQSQSGAEIKLDAGGQWEASQAITSYSTNLYLLDAANGKIWRHNKSGEVFTSGKTYAPAKNSDAKDGVSIAIDGAIYVLKADGNVAKFSHSIPDTSFVLGKIPSPSLALAKASAIYTDADSQYIFILDRENNRVVKYAKDGQYSGQYIIDGASVSQILVNSRNLKMWLISGKDVYEIDL